MTGGRPNTIETLFDQLSPEPMSGCWIWMGHPAHKGRAERCSQLRWNGSSKYPHRIFYEHYRGPIPNGHALFPRCENRYCVNPAHQEINVSTPEDKVLAVKRWQLKHRQQGLCIACSSPAIPRRAYCHKHLIAHRLKGYRSQGVSIAALAEIRSWLLNPSKQCSICGHSDGYNASIGRAVILDHDHQTGFPRGFLCGNCNKGIGWFKDRPDLLRAAADYLERTALAAMKSAEFIKGNGN